MNKLIASVMFLLVAIVATAQQRPAPVNQENQQRLAWVDAMRIETWSVGVVQKDEKTGQQFFFAIGSGVIVATGEHTGYFVTAKHVFFEPEKNWHPSELRLRFAWQEDKSVFDELGVPLTLRDAHGNDLWKSPDDGSDLAAIAPPADIKTKSAQAVFPDSFAKDADLFQGASVIVLGYPGVVGNEYLIRAIMRQGIVAWTNPADPLNNVFMVDANLYLGNSGGPVFRIPTGLTKDGAFSVGGKIAFLGIVSKVPIQNDSVTVDGQPLTFTQMGPLPSSGSHPASVQVVGVGGIGIIEPASKVLKLVQSFSNTK